MNPQWIRNESAMKPQWNRNETAMKPQWNRNETAMNPQWNRQQSAVDPPGGYQVTDLIRESRKNPKKESAAEANRCDDESNQTNENVE